MTKPAKTVSVTGTRLAVSTTAANTLLPFDSNGLFPREILFTATVSTCVKLTNGGTATTADLMVQPGDAVVLTVSGFTGVSAITVSGTGVLTMSPLENGPWKYDTKTLDLDFTASQAFDPRITFTRASNGTRFNSAGTLVTMSNDQPRIDYDPVTLACKGLLIEEQRTNLLTYSEQFDNAAWTKTRSSITANAVAAPDGLTTADKLVEDTTASNTHLVQASLVSLTTGAQTYSIYAKAAERTRIVLGSWDGSIGIDCVFNLNTGVVDVAGSGGTASITPVGNGWYRCSVSRTIASTTLSVYYYIDSGTSGGIANSYTGNGTSGIYIWGAQLEAGAFPTSYIPTAATQVTRAADVASMTGTNFSSWYNQTEGTLFTESSSLSLITSATEQFVCEIGDGGGTNVMRVTRVNGIGRFYAGTGSFDMSGGNWANLSAHKIAAAYKTNDAAYCFDAGSVATDTTVTVPVVTGLWIGKYGGAATNFLNGYIRRIAYYPTRLPNATLQALTA